MKSDWVKIVFAAVVLFTSLPGFAGGEVPWPLSVQKAVTAEHSAGLWYLKSERGQFYYNVEILDTYEDNIWMRITEIDSATLEVIHYGEGFYCKQEDKDSSQSQAGSEKEDLPLSPLFSPYSVGRYLYMFPESDTDQFPYVLRVVEVETELGDALGLSIYPRNSKEEIVHALGYKYLEKPLSCGYQENKYSCDTSSIAAPTQIAE